MYTTLAQKEDQSPLPAHRGRARRH